MIQKKYSILGHEVLYNVTENSAEFNTLDPSRPDAANDEAVSNLVYRSMNPNTRNLFLHGQEAEEAKDGKPAVEEIVGVEQLLEAMFEGVVYDKEDTEKGLTISRGTEVVKGSDGKPRLRDGVEITTFTESQERYYNRALSMTVKYKKFASEDVARAHFQPLIAAIALSVKLDPKAAPAAERGPKKLAAIYKIAAAKALSVGSIAKINKVHLSKIGKKFDESKDTSKMYAGKYPHKNADGQDVQVDFNVSDKDAETLGWLLKEHQDWKRHQELAALSE